MKNKKYRKTAAILLSASVLAACSDSAATDSTSTSNAASSAETAESVASLISNAVTYEKNDAYSDWESENPVSIALTGDGADFSSSAAVLFENNTLTIKAGGTYVLSGTFKGQIIVDAEDKNTVRLVLNGADIQSAQTAAIYVANSEKTVVSLAGGTKNTLSDAAAYQFDDASSDEPNAALFSKSDLTINGTGQLTVKGNYNNGIASKDALKIVSGTLSVTAVDDGIIGRDILAVKDGTIEVKAGGDALRSSNDEDTSKGNIALEGGTYALTASGDGIQSEAALWIAGGDYTISSGGGSPESVAGVTQKSKQPEAEATDSETEETSTKGLKANADLLTSGGTFAIDSLDDAVHSNAAVTIGGGTWTIASGDDAVHADTSLAAAGGTVTVTKSYEGLEGSAITVSGGVIDVTASDDGVNIGGGNDGSGMDMQAASESGKLVVSGGQLTVNASGDGLDSNGSIEITGGTVLVNGPTDNGNGSLDYDGSLTISGGLLIAAGSSGMVQAASDESSQSSILMTFPEVQTAETIVHVKDSKGNEVTTFAPAKEFQSIFISSPDLSVDTAYSLFTGGSFSGTAASGLYTDGTYTDGTKIIDFTQEETVTWLNESGVTEASAGGHGGGMPAGSAPAEGGRMGGMFEGLDEETKTKVQSIMEQSREGTITQEEAAAQLAELGVEMPVKGERPAAAE